MTLEQKIDRILLNKVEKVGNGGCAIFTGATTRGLPVINIDGKLKNLINVIVEVKYKWKRLASSRTTNQCGKKNCVNPAHWNFTLEADGWKPQWDGDRRRVEMNYITGRWDLKHPSL